MNNRSNKKWKGVVKRGEGYTGRISYQGKVLVKMHETEIEAALWYNERAKELYGEFAKMNIFTNEEIEKLSRIIKDRESYQKCTKCGEIKAKELFHIDKSISRGRKAACIACYKEKRDNAM